MDKQVFRSRERLLVVIVAIAFSTMMFFLSILIPGTIRPQLRGNQLEFHIDYGGTNGLLNLTVKSHTSGKVYWDVGLAYYRGNVLNYGIVPQEFRTYNGSVHNAVQRVPASGINPVPIEEGVVCELIAEWQSDDWCVPSSVSSMQYFSVYNHEIIMYSREDLARKRIDEQMSGTSGKPLSGQSREQN